MGLPTRSKTIDASISPISMAIAKMPIKSVVARFKERQRLSHDRPTPAERGFTGSSTTNDKRHGSLRPNPAQHTSAVHKNHLIMNRNAMIRWLRMRGIWTALPAPGDHIFQRSFMGFKHARDVPVGLLRVTSHEFHQRTRPRQIAFDRRMGMKGLPKADSDLAIESIDFRTKKVKFDLGVRFMGMGYWQKDVWKPVKTVRKESLLRHEWKP
ncbi:hypothetical protein Q7P37_006035 [Cladosporium fusiforme]